MARAPNEKAAEAYRLYQQDIKLVDIARQLDVPPGTVRRWKSTYSWDSERSDKNSERSVSNKSTQKRPIAEEVKQVMENPELTDKQRLFCLYYVKYFNATKAYQKAYECDYFSAKAHGFELLQSVAIKNEIQRLKQNKLNRAFLEPEDIVQKYIDIAFADITDYVEFGREEVPVMGPFGPIVIKKKGQPPAEMKKVINVVKFKESATVDGTIISEVSQGKDGAKIKLHDKVKALEWLADHMDLLDTATKEKLRIEQQKLDLEKRRLEGDDDEEATDDGFMEALREKVSEVWSDED